MNRLIYHSFSNFPLVAEKLVGWFRDRLLTFFFYLWSSHNLGSSSPLENIHIIGIQTSEKNLPRIFPKDRCPIKAFWDQSHDEELVTSTWTGWKIYSLDVCVLNEECTLHKITKWMPWLFIYMLDRNTGISNTTMSV